MFLVLPARGEWVREAISGPPSPEHSNEETNDRNLKFESKKTFRSEIRIIHYSPESSSGDRAGHDSAELIIESWHIQFKTFVILFQRGEASASLWRFASHWARVRAEWPLRVAEKFYSWSQLGKWCSSHLTLHWWQDWQKMFTWLVWVTVPWSLSDQIMVSSLVSSAGTGFPARTLSLLTRRSQDRDELSACSAVPERGGSSTLSCLRWPSHHLTSQKENPPPLSPRYLEKYLLMTQLQNRSGCTINWMSRNTLEILSAAPCSVLE